MRLDGRRILITGAGSGIGRALALEASHRGAAVGLCGRRIDKLTETIRLLKPGPNHQILPADVTVKAEVEDVMSALHDAWGGLDILVNNAGQIAAGNLEEMDPKRVAQLFETNIVAPILLSQLCLPLLRLGKEPRIINVGSMLGEIPLPGFVAYSASKAALKGFSVALRRELLRQGIAVTHAAPRATDTEGAASVAGEIAGNKLDDPAKVAADIWNAAEARRNQIYPSALERLFIAIQAIAPKIVDRATAQSRTARNAQISAT